MKFFHLSDLHIGLKLMNRDLSRDQAHILKEIIELAQKRQPEAVIIAGDIYDKAIPSAEAVSLFDEFITELSRVLPQGEIMLISGNHDSAPRVNVFRSLLSRHHLHMIGLPPMQPEDHIEKVTLSDEYGPVHFYLLPFVKPSMVKAITGSDENGNNLTYNAALHALLEREEMDPSARNVLVSHQFYLSTGKNALQIPRADSEIVTVGNIDSVGGDVLEAFDYAALGHIHQAMELNGKECYRFSGTPLPCSVSEAGQKKGLIEVELGPKGSLETTFLPLTPLHEVKKIKGRLQEVLAAASGDYVSVTLTDERDLDILDAKDRLEAAFPNLLETRRESREQTPGEITLTAAKVSSPFELCQEFLGELTDDEKKILSSIINDLQTSSPEEKEAAK